MDGGAYSKAHGPDLSIGPLPAWLAPVEIDRTSAGRAERVGDGCIFWFNESAKDLTGPEPTYTSRSVREVVASDGLASAATFELEFDPTSERAVVHYVRVVRNGVVRDETRSEAFELLRREKDLERSMFDGRVTAHMVISDVRVGDVVETAYSVIGANPALAGRFSAWCRLEWGVPLAVCQYRIRAPVSRKLATRIWGVRTLEHHIGERDGIREQLWRLTDCEAWRPEADTPEWHIGFAALRVCDEAAWSDIADVFRPYYGSDEPLPPELERQAAAIEAAHPDLGDRVGAALRLVQTELRYHSIALGAGGFVPRAVDAVWSSRFGDCKDASRLLALLLVRLGVDACPALVHTNGGTVEQDCPNVYAFNHCIVRAHVGGAVYWLDPTRSPQCGRLQRIAQARFGRALPLRAAAELESMGEDEPIRVSDAREVWRFGKKPTSPVTVEIETVLRSWRADSFRRWMRNDGLADVARSYARFYENQYGAHRELAPIRIEDDERENELRIFESYEFLSPWERSDDKGSVTWMSVDDVVGPQITTPVTPNRRAPIELGSPRRVRVERVLHLPRAVPVTPWDQVFRGPGVAYSTKCEVQPGNVVRLELKYRADRAFVAPEDAAAFFRFCDKARAATGLKISLPVAGKRFGRTSDLLWRAILAGVLITAAARGLELALAGG